MGGGSRGPLSGEAPWGQRVAAGLCAAPPPAPYGLMPCRGLQRNGMLVGKRGAGPGSVWPRVFSFGIDRRASVCVALWEAVQKRIVQKVTSAS